MYEVLKNELNIDIPKTEYEIVYGKKNHSKEKVLEDTAVFTNLIEDSCNDSEGFQLELKRMVDES